MKLSATGLAICLASFVVAEFDSRVGPSDYWVGYEPSDVAPVDCAKPTPYFDCYKAVSSYAYCDDTDHACMCSSVMVDKSCAEQNCGTSFIFDDEDSRVYCTGTATKGISAAGAQKTPNPAAPAHTEATPTPSSTAAGQTTASSRNAGGTASGTAASKPNAGERSMRVSAGGLFAVAAAAVGSFLYRL
ncbi:hypothetical protein MMC22_006950 [Lobaria immixta]|nr:hypothetical protein [Lobaria immixta]